MPLHHHVADQLDRQLLQHLICQGALLHALDELDKLHDISFHCMSLRVLQYAVVPVKFFHFAEIRIAHAHYNNADWKLCQIHNSILCLFHVCDVAVCQDKQNMILLL